MTALQLSGLRSRCRQGGLARARFWRRLGFPNLVLARAARWKGHVTRAERAAKAFSPFADSKDLPEPFASRESGRRKLRSHNKDYVN